MGDKKILYHLVQPDEISLDEEVGSVEPKVTASGRRTQDKDYLIKIRRTRRGGRRKLLVVAILIVITCLLALYFLFSKFLHPPEFKVNHSTIVTPAGLTNGLRDVDSDVNIQSYSDTKSHEPDDESMEDEVHVEDWNSMKDADFNRDQQQIEKNFNRSSVSAPFDISSYTDVIALIQIPGTTNELESYFTSSSIPDRSSSECGCSKSDHTCLCIKDIGVEGLNNELNWLYSRSTIHQSKCNPETTVLDYSNIMIDQTSPCHLQMVLDELDQEAFNPEKAGKQSDAIKRRVFVSTYLRNPIDVIKSTVFKPFNTSLLVDIGFSKINKLRSKSCQENGNGKSSIDPVHRISNCILKLASNHVLGQQLGVTSEDAEDIVKCHWEVMQDISLDRNLTKHEVKYLISQFNPFNLMTRYLAELNLIRTSAELNLESNDHTSDCDITALTLRKVETLLLGSAQRNLMLMSYFGIHERSNSSKSLLEATFPGFKIRSPEVFKNTLDPYASTQTVDDLRNDTELIAKIEYLNRLDVELYEGAVDLFNKRLKEHNIT